MQLFAHVTAKLASIPVIPELGPATIFWPYGGTLAPRIHLGGGGKSGRAEICQSCEKEGTVSIARAGDVAMKLDQERYLAVWCGTGSRPAAPDVLVLPVTAFIHSPSHRSRSILFNPNPKLKHESKPKIQW